MSRPPLEERLLDLLYGDLDAEEAAALEAEIKTDPVLRERLEAWRAVRHAMADLPEPEPDPQVRYAILRAARQAVEQPEKKGFFAWLSSLALNPAVAALGLAVVGGALWLTMSKGYRDADAPPAGRLEKAAPPAVDRLQSADGRGPNGQVADGQGPNGQVADGEKPREAAKAEAKAPDEPEAPTVTALPKADEAEKAEAFASPSEGGLAERARRAEAPALALEQPNPGDAPNEGLAAGADGKGSLGEAAPEAPGQPARGRDLWSRGLTKDQAPAAEDRKKNAGFDDGVGRTEAPAKKAEPPQGESLRNEAEGEARAGVDSFRLGGGEKAGAKRKVDANTVPPARPGTLDDSDQEAPPPEAPRRAPPRPEAEEAAAPPRAEPFPAEVKAVEAKEPPRTAARGPAAADEAQPELTVADPDVAEEDVADVPAEPGDSATDKVAVEAAGKAVDLAKEAKDDQRADSVVGGALPQADSTPDVGREAARRPVVASVAEPQAAAAPQGAEAERAQGGGGAADPPALVEARQARNQGRHEVAVEAYQRYLASEPGDDQFASAMLEAAQSYEALNDLARALQLYRLAGRSSDPRVARIARERIAAIETLTRRAPPADALEAQDPPARPAEAAPVSGE